jgi:threonine aldolase
VHLDGARIWHAAVALGVPPAALVAGADTVMACFSKGLCAPVGSILASSRERIEEARRARKLLGGGMRQAGVLAAAALVALDRMVPRLADDHANARLLGQALARCRGVEVAPVETNIVVALLQTRSAPEAVAALKQEGVLATAMDARTLRLVTHHDVSREDCERAAAAIGRAMR